MNKKNSMKQIKFMTFVFIFIVLFSSCHKFLDKKSDQSLVIPSTLADCQALLDYNGTINQFQNTEIGETSADNYYLSDADWASLNQMYESRYIWGDEIFFDASVSSNEWA